MIFMFLTQAGANSAWGYKKKGGVFGPLYTTLQWF